MGAIESSIPSRTNLILRVFLILALTGVAWEARRLAGKDSPESLARIKARLAGLADKYEAGYPGPAELVALANPRKYRLSEIVKKLKVHQKLNQQGLMGMSVTLPEGKSVSLIVPDEAFEEVAARIGAGPIAILRCASCPNFLLGSAPQYLRALSEDPALWARQERVSGFVAVLGGTLLGLIILAGVVILPHAVWDSRRKASLARLLPSLPLDKLPRVTLEPQTLKGVTGRLPALIFGEPVFAKVRSATGEKLGVLRYRALGSGPEHLRGVLADLPFPIGRVVIAEPWIPKRAVPPQRRAS